MYIQPNLWIMCITHFKLIKASGEKKKNFENYYYKMRMNEFAKVTSETPAFVSRFLFLSFCRVFIHHSCRLLSAVLAPTTRLD